jgi:hypothetical protein
MDDEGVEALKRYPAGSVIRCNIVQMRNAKFFRKWWSLAKMAFELASERMQPRMYKGHQVLPSFDAFRKDLTILAGYFVVVYKYDGTFRLEAQSLKWSEMDEGIFEKMYSATIDAILQKVLPNISRQELDRAVALTLAYV